MQRLKKLWALTAVAVALGVVFAPAPTVADPFGGSSQIIQYYCAPDFEPSQLVGGEGGGYGWCGGSWRWGITGPWRVIYDTPDCGPWVYTPEVVTWASCAEWVDGEWRRIDCPWIVCESLAGCAIR